MSNNNAKKKAVLVGLGLFWAAAITAVGVSIPFVMKNKQVTNESPTPKKDEVELVKTSLINNNEHQIQIKVTNLEDYVGQWLKVEYKPQNSTNLKLTASEATFSRSFYVRNATEVVAIGGLVANVKYDYLIKTMDGKTLSSDAVFWTHSKAELNTESDESSIRFFSSELNKEYLTNSIVLRYKVFDSSVNSAENYDNTKELAVAIESKEIEGRVVYTISGQINDLTESTPYVITLHIRGQEGTIANPIIVWTRGNDAKIIATNVTTTSASAQISGLDDYIAAPNPLVSFWVQYAEVGNTASTLTETITLGSDAIFELPISGLKHNTQYSMVVMKRENEIEEVLTKETKFWTKPEPFVKTKTFEGIETSWRKSDVNAMVVVSGLASKGGQAVDSLNSSDLEVVAVEIANSADTPDFTSTLAKKFNLSPADATDNDDYPVLLSELALGKMYAIQVFEKTDTTFSNPMLADNFINTQMPTLFSQEVLDLTENSAKVKIKNINNYKSNETILRYWKESTPNDKVDVKIEFADNATEAEVTLSSLDKNTKYKFAVLPVYSQLQTDADDLLESQGEFKTFDILTAGAFEGNHFTENVKFKLSGMDSRFPTGQETKIQWRLKPADPTMAWTEPTSTDSSTFTVNALPTDGNYDIEVSNDNRLETWYTGADYQWRVVKSSDVTTNLVKEGSAEFNLTDDKLTKTFNPKVASSFQDQITWRAPLIENVVAGKLGFNGNTTIWRNFFGLTSKTQWQHFLEWLAFQDDTIQDKVIANIVLAFKTYGRTTANYVSFPPNNFTQRFTAVPYPPSNDGANSGPSENGTWQSFGSAADENTPKFGGYTNNEFPSASPIKPSDFMGTNSKFKNWTDFPKAIKFTLNRIKTGFDDSAKAIGISRNNIFATNINALELGQTYASRISDKKALDTNFAFATVTSTDANDWAIETLESESNANLWSNDVNGELYVKVKATKESKVHYYWTKISGFKTSDATTLPTENDLSFQLYPDHAKSARIINKEIQDATDDNAKKALIEKYYKVSLSSQSNVGWTFVGASLSEDGNNLVVKAKIPTKVVTKGVVTNTTDKADLNSDATTEFTYNLEGYDFSKMANLGPALEARRKGSLSASESDLPDPSRYVNINWTYEQMLNRMKDAVLQGDDKITELANLILTNLDANSDWKNTSDRFYMRTIGTEPVIAEWLDFTWTAATKKINDANKNGFVTQNTLGTDDQDNRLAKMVEMIKHYGA